VSLQSEVQVAKQARRRVAVRLLPFVFLLYVVAYIDRVNVSFAGLRMNADLRLSDSAFGLGSGVFYVGYVLCGIPGAMIVERWGARIWISRTMISWGLVTILTAFVHTGGQFYLVRLLLGVTEASFFPGMIVYLTRWFSLTDRGRAIASLYAANPTATLIGSPLAGLLLDVHWLQLPGWRWLFILEGIPAVILGLVTAFYLTDQPAQAGWLPENERKWLVSQLNFELQEKKKIRNYAITEAFRDRQILLMIAPYFLALSGSIGTIYWLPSFVKRLSGSSVGVVTSLLLIPAVLGIVGILINGWHSDKANERRWHAAVPLMLAGFTFGLAACAAPYVPLAISCLLLGSGLLFAYYPAFWAMPTMILSGSAAAATIGLTNSIGQIGGFAGPWAIGFLNDRTHSLFVSFGLIAVVYIAAAGFILRLQIPQATRSTWIGESAPGPDANSTTA
jgi:ACS family tartrate transporter-like MFS transporter